MGTSAIVRTQLILSSYRNSISTSFSANPYTCRNGFLSHDCEDVYIRKDCCRGCIEDSSNKHPWHGQGTRCLERAGRRQRNAVPSQARQEHDHTSYPRVHQE